MHMGAYAHPWVHMHIHRGSQIRPTHPHTHLIIIPARAVELHLGFEGFLLRQLAQLVPNFRTELVLHHHFFDLPPLSLPVSPVLLDIQTPCLF